VTTIDLRDFPLPVFDEDLETTDGLPGPARALKDLFRDHDGLLIASPEYNSSLSAVLKNTIDWISRPEADEPPLSCFVDKVAGIMAASPGGLGGLRGLVHLRSMLGTIQVIVIPHQVAVPSAGKAFDESGRLLDDRKRKQVEQIGRTVATMIAKLVA
jgi:NAD(P)H-dependent FMN reductase